MRTRSEIELDADAKGTETLNVQAIRIQPLILEVLLDIRDLLVPLQPTMLDLVRKHFQDISIGGS